MKQELEWRPATRIELVDQGVYPANSVAFTSGWVFVKSPSGIDVFPASQVVRVSLG